MSAHRGIWQPLHASGTCDTCDQERDQQEWDHEQEAQEQAPQDGATE
jgi:hypothetical protein